MPRSRPRAVRCSSGMVKLVSFRLQPTANDCVRMLTDLLIAFKGDRRDLCAVLGVSLHTLGCWLNRRAQSDPARKLIWMTWALLLHPELLRTVWHIVTWGRYAKFDPHCSVHPPSEPPLGHPTQQDGDDPGKLPS